MMDLVSRLAASDTLLTVDAVAKILQVSEGWVRQHANGTREPHLKSVKMGTSRRFEASALAAFIESMRE